MIETPNPHGIMEIILGDFAQNPVPPGFGHQMISLCNLLIHCQKTNLCPRVDDSTWCYGRWEDFFTPLVQECPPDLPITQTVNTNLEAHGYGHLYHYHWPEMFQKIYVFNESTQKRIQEEIATFQEIDVAVHFRIGYEAVHMRIGLEQHKQAILSLPKYDRIFALSDDIRAIYFLQESFPDKEILTLCPESHDGHASIRGPENLFLLLKEMEIARQATHFVQTGFSGVSMLINQLRR